MMSSQIQRAKIHCARNPNEITYNMKVCVNMFCVRQSRLVFWGYIASEVIPTLSEIEKHEVIRIARGNCKASDDAVRQAGLHSGALMDKQHSLVVLERSADADLGGEAGGEVTFVRWTDASLRLARRLSLDSMGRVKTIVAYRVPICDFSAARIVVEVAPVEMRVGGVASELGRPQVPDWLLLLKSIEEARQYSGPVFGSATRWCIVCGVLNSHSGEAADADREELNDDLLIGFTCVQCASLWHSVCVAKFTSSPIRLDPFVCPYCGKY
jgi:hypothetical protein